MMEEPKVPPVAPAALPRPAFYLVLSFLVGLAVPLAKPWVDRCLMTLVPSASEWLYGTVHRPPLIAIALLVPVAALVADVLARWVARLCGAVGSGRPLALGCEALIIGHAALFVLAGASINATFGAFPRLLVLGTLMLVTVATSLVGGQLGWFGRIVAATPFVALGLCYPAVLPPLFAMIAALVTAGLVRAPAPEDEPQTAARATAAFGLLAATLTLGSFLLLEYGLALGLNIVPAIESWNSGCFARMERGCLATRAVLPYDPVWRVFLSDIRAQQGKYDEARTLAREVVDSGAGGSCGALANKLLAYLDRFDAMRKAAAAKAHPPPADQACAPVHGPLCDIEAILEFGTAVPGAISGTPESLAFQALPMLREVLKKAPECPRAHALLVRALDRAIPRVKTYQQKVKLAKPEPGDPYWPDLEAERARSAAALERLTKVGAG